MEILLILKMNLLKWLNCFTKNYDNLDELIDESIINQYDNL